jgi:hypothetical protein
VRRALIKIVSSLILKNVLFCFCEIIYWVYSTENGFAQWCYCTSDNVLENAAPLSVKAAGVRTYAEAVRNDSLEVKNWNEHQGLRLLQMVKSQH